MKTPLDPLLFHRLTSLVLIIYSVLIAPQLPSSISKYFHQPIVQLLFLGIILYTATVNITNAILLAIAFMLSFHAYSRSLLNRVAKQSEKLFNRLNSVHHIPEKVYNEDNESHIGYVKLNATLPHGLELDKIHLKKEAEDALLPDPYKAMNQHLSIKGYQF